MKQLVIGVLLAALLSLGYRLVGTFTASADAPPPPAPKQEVPDEKDPTVIKPAAVRVDWFTPERLLARNDNTGPDRTLRGEEASQRSRAIPRSAAKPFRGPKSFDLTAMRTPPAALPEPRMIGPDGIAYHRIGATTSSASAQRLTPLPVDEPLVQAAPSQPEPESAPIVRETEPLPQTRPVRSAVHGKMVGPDGIEFRPVQRGN